MTGQLKKLKNIYKMKDQTKNQKSLEEKGNNM